MVDINVVSERLKQLSLRIAKVRALCPAGLEGLVGDALDPVSFNLLLAVSSLITMAWYRCAQILSVQPVKREIYSHRARRRRYPSPVHPWRLY
jgi:hypothetical protein